MLLGATVNFLSAIWLASRIEAKIWRWLAIALVMVSWSISPAWLSWVILQTPAFLWPMLGFWRAHQRRGARVADLRRLVEMTILAMRAGRSFRTAFAKSVNGLGTGEVERLAMAWLQSLQVSSSVRYGPKWWQAVATELVAIDRQPHQAMARLQSWRTRIKRETDVGRRIGQVVLQARLQAGLISGLYLALLIYSFVSGQLHRFPGLSFVSMGLFVFGIFVTWRLGRRIQWNF